MTVAPSLAKAPRKNIYKLKNPHIQKCSKTLDIFLEKTSIAEADLMPPFFFGLFAVNRVINPS